MMGPSVNCSTTSGGAQAPYCFQLGVFLGFTPFALVMLALWVLPLMLGALAATVQNMEVRPKKPQGTVEEGGESTAATGEVRARKPSASRFQDPRDPQKRCGFEARAMAVWFLFNALWFGLPLAQYCFLSPFIANPSGRDCSSPQLASIPRRPPLLWRLLPPTTPWYLTPTAILGAQARRALVFWAVLHAGGQFASNPPDRSVPASRCTRRESPLHRLITILLMLLSPPSASAPPQPQFRLPYRRRPRPASPPPRIGGRLPSSFAPPSVSPQRLWLSPPSAAVPRPSSSRLPMRCARAPQRSPPPLAPPLSASLSCGYVRERVMIRAHADTYSPFAFPPLAVAMSYLFARAAAYLVLFNWRMRPKERAAPLLPEGQTLG